MKTESELKITSKLTIQEYLALIGALEKTTELLNDVEGDLNYDNKYDAAALQSRISLLYFHLTNNLTYSTAIPGGESREM